MLKFIILVLLFVGILFVSISIILSRVKCQNEKIIYKYIPQSFEEQQMNEPPVSKIFEKIFKSPDTWIGSINELDRKKQEEINKYFISQM